MKGLKWPPISGQEVKVVYSLYTLSTQYSENNGAHRVYNTRRTVRPVTATKHPSEEARATPMADNALSVRNFEKTMYYVCTYTRTMPRNPRAL